MDNYKDMIVERLKKGQAARKELVKLTGLTDRGMRKLIEHMRSIGIPIINTQDNRGYRFPDDKADLERWKKQEIARGTKVINTAKSLKYGEDYQISI